MMRQAKGFEVKCQALALVLLFLLAILPAMADQSVMLGWQPSADPNVAGYKIYYGTTSHNYSSTITVGNVTSATISALSAGKTYFFAATTYNSANQESGFSNEASYAVPLNTNAIFPGNQPPTLGGLGDVVINENAALQTVALSGISSGSTNEAQPLKVTVTSSKTSLIPTPKLTYSSPNSTGTLTFKPNTSTSGTAIITVTVNDGGTSNNLITRTFTVTVNPNLPPTLNALGNVAVDENSPPYVMNLTGITSGSPTENQLLKVTVTSSKTTLIPTPTLVYSSPRSTGTLTFKPVNNAFGSATLAVTVNDGGTRSNKVIRTFTVTVNRTTNQPPTLNDLGNVVINENVPAQIITLSGITSGSPNEDQPLKVTVASSKTSLIPTPTLTYSSPNSTGTLAFKPVNNANGTAIISVSVNDGGIKSNLITKTFTVTVIHVPNIPPTLGGLGDVVINENAALQTVALSGISSGSTNEAQPLKVTVTSSKTSLIPTPKLTYSSPNSTGTLTFKPNTSTSGTAIITVTVNDGGTSNNLITRTFTVTVNPNLPPTLNALGNVAVDENSPPYVMNLTGITSGSPTENQLLKVTVTSSKTTLIPTPTLVYSSPRSTGTLTFKPVNNAFGSATLAVTVNDGGTRSNKVIRTFTVTVNRTTNQPPTLNDLGNVVINENVPAQIITLSGITSGSPNEDQPLKVTVASSKTSLIPTPTLTYSSPNSTGTLAFKPVNNANGTAIISVSVNDGGIKSNLITKTFTVTVIHVNIPPTLDPINDVTFNQPPTLNPIDDYIVNKNAGWQTVPLTGISSGDPAGNQKMTVTASCNDTVLIPNPTVNYSGTNATGYLSFKPVANMTGTTVIRVTVKDNGNPNRTVTQTFIVTVLGQTSSPGRPAISNLTITNTAVAGQNLAFSVSALGTAQLHYQWKFNGGDITFATNAVLFLNQVDVSQSGDYSVMVFNHNGATNSSAVSVVISSPTINAATQAASVNSDPTVITQTIPLTGITSGSSRETQTLTVTAVSSNPTLIPNPDINYLTPKSTGSLSFSPIRNASGTATISVTVNDGGSSNNIITRTFNITVNPSAVISQVAKLSLAATVTNDQSTVTNSASDSTTDQNTQSKYITFTSIASSNLATTSNFAVSPPQPMVILTPAGFTNGQFAFSVSGVTNYECMVQASTNLVDWTTIETNTTPFVFIDYNAGQFEHRYYRTVGK